MIGPMRHLLLPLVLAACNPNVEQAARALACEEEPGGEPNGYCEEDSDCDPADHCLLERTRDSHLQGRLPAVVAVERCLPRSVEGDWCMDDTWCLAGLHCGDDRLCSR